MHVERFLHKLLVPAIHKARVRALAEVVTAAIDAKELRLTTVGRFIGSGIQERSGIQKVNRLLCNKHLLGEQTFIAKLVSGLLIGNKSCPVIIVDWTKYPNSEDAVLRASLAVEGRALTVYEERHSIKKMGNRVIHTSFLKTLKRVLPKDCKATVVTDAGFHNAWFKEVVKLGWDYVGRVRGLKKYCREDQETFYACSGLFKYATHQVKCLGKMILTRKNPMQSYFYLVKSRLKGRKALTRQGRVRMDKDSKAYSQAYREPWLLASSLNGRQAAKKVNRVYKCRMTIEEAFRDLKSSKYGFGLEEGKTVQEKRRDIWLLIAMLAGLIAWLTGKVGEQIGLQYQFQSNSIKTRRVLSLFYLGCQMIRKRIRLTLSQIGNAIASLQQEAIYD